MPPPPAADPPRSAWDDESGNALALIFPLVTAIVRQTAGRYLLSRDEQEELRSYVFLKLLEDDRRRLREFRGDSSLRTYLVVVVKRLYIDLVIQQRGKWRPSAAARRAGDVVERVEELVCRDGYTVAQAYEHLTTNLGVEITPSALEEIVAMLRPRRAPTFDTREAVDEVADERFRPDAPLDTAERARRSARFRQVWNDFVATLSGEDQLICALHFDDEVKSARIAHVLRCPVQHVYSRVDRIKGLARRHLASAGLTPDWLEDGRDAE